MSPVGTTFKLLDKARNNRFISQVKILKDLVLTKKN